MLHHSNVEVAIFLRQNQQNPLSKTEKSTQKISKKHNKRKRIKRKMHCRTKWSKLPLLLNWGPWKRESKSTWVNKMADLKELLFIQQEALYTISLTLFLSFFASFIHKTNKKERILLTPPCLQERREKWDLGKKKNEWWGNMRESRPDQTSWFCLKGDPTSLTNTSCFPLVKGIRCS